MTNQITGTALLQSDFDRIDEEVDRIAMAYCEAQLIAWARQRGSYTENTTRMREALLEDAHTPILHLLYWFDIRADYWRQHRPPEYSQGRDDVTLLLQNFERDAERLQRLAWQARAHDGDRISAHGEEFQRESGSQDERRSETERALDALRSLFKRFSV